MLSFIVTLSLLVVHITLQVGFIMRAILRPHREPSSRIAWILIILALPGIGMTAYVLFGETNIGRRNIERYKAASVRLGPVTNEGCDVRQQIEKATGDHAHLFALAHSVNGFFPETSNTARLMSDSNSLIESMIEDIDAAQQHVHVLFYIWLEDNNGLKVVEALKRAAARGVVVRAMADDLGSRKMIRSRHWEEMRTAGVRLAQALPVGNLLLHPIRGRVDLRNHRKIVVIDNWITYSGSQNCADPEFLPRPKYAPWVDLMVRFEGPIAAQNQLLFLQDWVCSCGRPLLRHDRAAREAGHGRGRCGPGRRNWTYGAKLSDALNF
ncbi:phospholipase D-like domain-containing protein [Pseudophaeobacter sp.]|uniref:phospholipase D-like domain-containing protein n=1 Tax=Pseudophaeobacter sp. TaxID=1971739 RepID=UPI0026158ED4|nr:phospholipase D-like domain-containing protein [Pseudophaeobacter sp.]